jgi:DNA-binding NarL/FixJ family response regulator
MKKIYVVLISKDPGYFSELSTALADDAQMSVSCLGSAGQVYQAAEKGQVDVLVAAEEVRQSSGLQLIRELVRRHPFINCALVSPLNPQEFHEATEGLGIFMQLPPAPDGAQAAKIREHLAAIS